MNKNRKYPERKSTMKELEQLSMLRDRIQEKRRKNSIIRILFYVPSIIITLLNMYFSYLEENQYKISEFLIDSAPIPYFPPWGLIIVVVLLVLAIKDLKLAVKLNRNP
jgi:hypothetical protein